MIKVRSQACLIKVMKNKFSKNIYHQGLSDEQVLESRRIHGANVLTPPEKESLWHKFIEKFEEPIIILGAFRCVACSAIGYWSGFLL